MGSDARGLVATATTQIEAPVGAVWRGLTEPGEVAGWMFGTKLDTEWAEGGPVTWSGEYEGKAYQDKGEVVAVEPEHLLRYTHYSPMSGDPDVPESYHLVTTVLEPVGSATKVTITQDNNDTEDAQDHSAQNWRMMLDALRNHVEG